MASAWWSSELNARLSIPAARWMLLEPGSQATIAKLRPLADQEIQEPKRSLQALKQDAEPDGAGCDLGRGGSRNDADLTGTRAAADF